MQLTAADFAMIELFIAGDYHPPAGEDLCGYDPAELRRLMEATGEMHTSGALSDLWEVITWNGLPEEWDPDDWGPLDLWVFNAVALASSNLELGAYERDLFATEFIDRARVRPPA